jgi:dethiobiotin synthase
VKDLLVTGTDTAIGKTAVSAGLLLALRDRGVACVGFKPVETGTSSGEETDSALLARASSSADPAACPLLALPEPLAPAVAAERAGALWDPSEAVARIRDLRSKGLTVVVEGAGGILVPWSWGFTALDLAAQAGLDALVVGRPGLGTLNHVLLTVGALRDRGVRVAAVVLNRVPAAPDLAESTNPGALRRLLPGLPVHVLPDEGSGPPWEVAVRLGPRLGPILDGTAPPP